MFYTFIPTADAWGLLLIAVIVCSTFFGVHIGSNGKSDWRSSLIFLASVSLLGIFGGIYITKGVEIRTLEDNTFIISEERRSVELYNNRMTLRAGIYTFDDFRPEYYGYNKSLGDGLFYYVTISGNEVKRLEVIFPAKKMGVNPNFKDKNTLQIAIDTYGEPSFIFPNKEP